MAFSAQDFKHCDFECIPQHGYVCGHDMVTYQNDCVLKHVACLRKRAVIIVGIGRCKDRSLPDNIRCNFQCTSNLGPVCGSDSRVYADECALRRHVCITKVPISLTFQKLTQK